MRFNDIENDVQLWEFMTDPSDQLVESVFQLKGSIIILGGSGKMGKELVGLLRYADKKSGMERDISVASTFGNSNAEDMRRFQTLDVNIYKGDLSDEQFLNSLPDAPNVVYMMGFKFGSSGDWTRAFHLNSIVPYLVGKKYSNAKIVVFSSGNPYPHTSRTTAGSDENMQFDPKGIYGWSIVARESSFRVTSDQFPNQCSVFYRLMYAQHLCYGVLIDLARMIKSREPISLAMPAVNLVSQRDANEIALRSFELCNNPPETLNVAGPVWQVKDIVERLEKIIGEKAILIEDEEKNALIADDSFCVENFGKYRDVVEDMIEAAGNWVNTGGTYWNKPTFFGRADHRY